MNVLKISVAMCTYNGERYLREQLESIASQTRPPDELVVCDDLSADATAEIVTSFAASVAFPVRLYVNDRNLGSTRNFEQAIRICEGDLIALADQDDEWMPEKLGRIEDCFVSEPEVGLVFTDAEVVDEQMRPLGYSLWESVGFDSAQRRLVRTGRALDVLLPGWTVTGATMVFRAGFKNLVLDVPANLPLIHDGWIALLIASVAGVRFIEEPLIQYRQHARQQIGARKSRADARVVDRVSVRDALQRTNSYQDTIEIGTEIQRRLLERSGVYKCDVALAGLTARLTHLRMRAKLPESALRRATSVMTEVLSGRYHRYSRGFYSAAKDLLHHVRGT